MTNEIAPEWIPWKPAKWLAAAAEMDMTTEFVFFRLCMFAYDDNSPVVRGSERRNAMRCKVSLDDFQAAIELLIEFEKVEVAEGGFFIPSVVKRMDDASSRMLARQQGAAKARRKRELIAEGRSSKEIELIINEEFSDNQSDDQRRIKKETKDTKIKTHTKGGVGENQLDLLPDEKPLDECDVAFEYWNSRVSEHNLSKAMSMSPARRKKMKARLREVGGLEGWSIAVGLVHSSHFLTARVPGKNWKANLDFMLQAGSFVKIMEKSYPPYDGDAPTRGSALMSAFNELKGAGDE